MVQKYKMAARDSRWPQGDYFTICYRPPDPLSKKSKSGPKFTIGTKWPYVEHFCLAPIFRSPGGPWGSQTQHLIATVTGQARTKINKNRNSQFLENRFWKSTFCITVNGPKFKIVFFKIVKFNFFLFSWKYVPEPHLQQFSKFVTPGQLGDTKLGGQMKIWHRPPFCKMNEFRTP